MKLFGKKTLALILALSMVMSVCVFAGDAKTLEVNETATLTATAPEGKTVIWESGDDTKVTVDSNGSIKGIAVGEATVVARYCSVEAAEGVEAEYTTLDTWNITVVAKEITAIALKNSDDATIEIPYGVAFSASDLNDIELSVTYANGATKDIKATSWTKTSDTELGAIDSTATYQATVADLKTGVEAPTVTVTVEKAVISEDVKLTDVTVPLNIQGPTALGKLPTSISVKLQDGSTKTLKIGTELEWAPEGFKTDVAGTYPITAKVKSEYADKYGIASDKSISVKIIVTDALKTGTLELKMVADEYDDTASGFKSRIEEQVESAYGVTISNNAEYKYDTDEGTAYGAFSGSTYEMDLDSDDKAKLREDGKLVDTFECTVKDGGVTYTVPVELTIYYIVYNTGARRLSVAYKLEGGGMYCSNN